MYVESLRMNKSSGLRAQDSGLKDQGSAHSPPQLLILALNAEGSGVRDQGSGRRTQCSRLRAQGSGIPPPLLLILARLQVRTV